MKAFEKMKIIFWEALEKETENEREAYLNEACKDDPSLPGCVTIAQQNDYSLFYISNITKFVCCTSSAKMRQNYL